LQKKGGFVDPICQEDHVEQKQEEVVPTMKAKQNEEEVLNSAADAT
jgi:hypothetical protein